MNKRSIQVCFALVFLLTACATPAATVTPAAIANPSASPSQQPTNTLLPTETLTPSITPLPTIPTFTPTFDVSTIVTVTPASKAECPETSPDPKANVDIFDLLMDQTSTKIEEKIILYLDKYDAEPFVRAAQDYWKNAPEYIAFQDFTNDGLPELAIGIYAFHIFGCKDGHYEELMNIPPSPLSGPAKFFSIEDNNRNGLVEFTLLIGFLSQGGHSYAIYEWNGERFENLLLSTNPAHPDWGSLWVEATGEIHYEDLDKDLVQELILDSGIPVWETYHAGLPWRNERTFYKWNGQDYVPYKKEFASPEYRFQAVQDGDLAVSQNEFEKAVRLYEESISDSQLKSYSTEIRENLRANWDSRVGRENPPSTLTPYPNDSTEYPRLAAYAYYRIMLLHFAQGNEQEADLAYETLQQKFDNDQYGLTYVEMANAFWNTYQSTQNMYDGCAAAIQYAAEHPEILTPLGSDYHGWQSHTYLPADVCPFR